MFDRMEFSGEWRDYQARVLSEMSDHLGDGRLHVVAAPGAGKTVLGLEIVRRLGRPAVVFAPSVAIRDQWKERLVPLFMSEAPRAEEVSRSLAEPKALTLATYQSLDTYRRSDDLSALIESLSNRGPLTLVLDEAHHLRRAWWECLDRLTNELPEVTIVALTATPPYDASFAEWSRYEGLCGPIDLEIGIPELVRNGDLCPHQDQLILSEPTDDALALLERRRVAISDLQSDLREDADLLDRLEQHPWLTEPDANIESILDAPEMLSAILVLLGSTGRELPKAPLDLLGVKAKDLPLPSLFWLERLLDGLLFRHTDEFPLESERRETLQKRLQRHGLIEGKRVRLRHTRSVFRLLASSLAKLESIADIAHAEKASLGDDLRMVVLSDHIRAGELPRSADAEFKPAKLGVIPIFESLRRADIEVDHLAVLTGSLVIIPRAALNSLPQICSELRLDPSHFRQKEMKPCPDHVELTVSGGGSANLIRLITAMLIRGDLRILVGTQSLLGQGWDAPVLNSLILASNTASFMLSNQMRGRAIRIDPGTPNKVANIWHLATIEPDMNGLVEELADALDWGAFYDQGSNGVSDIGVVARRFRAFEGISNGESRSIESGLGRLALEPRMSIATQNASTLKIAADRAGTVEKWRQSLGMGEEHSQVRETASPTYAPRALSWSDTLHAMAWTTASSAGIAMAEQVRTATSAQGLAVMAMGAFGVATAMSLPRLARAARLAWRNGSLEGSLREVTRVVLGSMLETGMMTQQEFDQARIVVRTSINGRKMILLRSVGRSTERQVMQAISEILGPVQNPRYVLLRKSWLGLVARTDYHAVPSVLGARKEHAEIFGRNWRKTVGESELVFTRNAAGRQILLRARMRSFASGFQRAVDRRSAWL